MKRRRDEKQESTSGIIGRVCVVEWRKGQSRERIVARTTDPVIVAFLLKPDDPATFRQFLLTSSIPISLWSLRFFFSFFFFLSTCDKQRGCSRLSVRHCFLGCEFCRFGSSRGKEIWERREYRGVRINESSRTSSFNERNLG